MADALPTFKVDTIPQSGVIRGGLLDGWAFTFLRLEIDLRGVVLVVQLTQPGWPFPLPTETRLRAHHFDSLDLMWVTKTEEVASGTWLNNPKCAPCFVPKVDLVKLIKAAVPA